MERQLILSIETSTDLCSVCLSSNGSIVEELVAEQPRTQSGTLAPLIDTILKNNNLQADQLAAVAVSQGPGSYTGLRVGVSTAKGLCFGAGVPLVAVSTLELLAQQGLAEHRRLHPTEPDPDFIVPMIDARRMEVYSAVFDSSCLRISEIEPMIIDSSSFAGLLEKGRVLFCGNGAAKVSEAIVSDSAEFIPCDPHARFMAQAAHRALSTGKKEDVAYFEPYYLKEFMVTKSKKDPLRKQ